MTFHRAALITVTLGLLAVRAWFRRPLPPDGPMDAPDPEWPLVCTPDRSPLTHVPTVEAAFAEAAERADSDVLRRARCEPLPVDLFGPNWGD